MISRLVVEVVIPTADALLTALWRAPIGSSGILNFFLGILPTPGLRPLLRSHVLRLIGNSCADTGRFSSPIGDKKPSCYFFPQNLALTQLADENRARVVESGRIHAIIELLHDDSLLPFVIPVLYNVLVDYGESLQHRQVTGNVLMDSLQNLSSSRLVKPASARGSWTSSVALVWKHVVYT